jgi:hypothetical protein
VSILEHAKTGPSDGHREALTDPTLDLLEAFGPMASMHAAMDRVGAGMPCAMAARFAARSAAEVEQALTSAARCFPVLNRRLVWRDDRAMLVSHEKGRRAPVCSAPFTLSFRVPPDGTPWCCRVVQDGADARLAAVFTHAIADGFSMLRFLEKVGAALRGHESPPAYVQLRPSIRRTNMTSWLFYFAMDRTRGYVRARDNAHPPAAAWLTIPSAISDRLLADARTACGGFAGWLAAAACMAICEQQRRELRGKVRLNLQIARDNLERFGGFGFGVGSLIMPVKVEPASNLDQLARIITERARTLANEDWDGNFERLLGRATRRHHRFATLWATGRPDPTLSVSWKGRRSTLGGADGIRDVACFGVVPTAHVSAHADRNGLSVSVTSRQSPASRDDLLRRIVERMMPMASKSPILRLEDHLGHRSI